MAREVLSNGVINPDKYQADWYADLSNNWNLLNNLIGSAISGSEVDSKIAIAIQELMIRTFQIVTELPVTGTEGVMYLVLIPDTSKYTAYVWENNAYRELGVIQMTITIDDELSTTSENPVQNKVITNALNNKAPISHTHSASDITSGLSTVATSGSYNDLSNKPTIPSKTSDLTNDSGFITSDDTKIPLAGSNQISGSLIPATDNAIDIGSSTKNIKMLYTKGMTIAGTQFLPSDYIPLSGTNALSGSIVPDTDNSYTLGGSSYNFQYIYAKFLSSNDDLNLYSSFSGSGIVGSFLTLKKIDSTSVSGSFQLNAHNGHNIAQLIGYPNGTLTWENKNVAMQEDVIPRSGGAVLSGDRFCRTVNDNFLILSGSNDWLSGACVAMYGSKSSSRAGEFQLFAMKEMSTGTVVKEMDIKPDGTWTWNGTACQITSDQRLKQQIAEIDDKLLDAWEDVDLVQFKYNDAVDQKKDKARLHTGYVVQQIDEACKSHNVDISEYGLYCHEEYPEETEEVEVEQADGTKVKERKVIREASEHYSLRYTEALIIECAYLRKKNKELQEQLDKLSARLDKLEGAQTK